MQYDLILADPPWKYNSRANHKTRFRGGADGHYKLMTMAEIKALDVESIAAPNAILFLWATFPFMEEQIGVFKAWGFKYKTLGFSWAKFNKNGTPFFGVGYYSKSNMEPCLLGTRGTVLKPAVNDVSSYVPALKGRHSAKPDEVRRRISRMYPTLNKVELFARDCAPGWTATGLEYDGLDIREFIRRENADRRGAGDPETASRWVA